MEKTPYNTDNKGHLFPEVSGQVVTFFAIYSFSQDRFVMAVPRPPTLSAGRQAIAKHRFLPLLPGRYRQANAPNRIEEVLNL
jgi:hypothetical protein